MRIRKSWMLGGIIILVVAGSSWMLLHKKPANDETSKVINPHFGSIESVITTTATVLPKNRLEIKPTVSGRVEQVLVQEGQLVKTGAILGWMSSTDRAALLDSARGQGEKEYKYWEDVYKPIPLLAPIDGQVIVATTQPGQTVTNADAIVVLSDRLIVRAQVDETDIGKIKLGQAARISLGAYPDKHIEASVDHIYYESKTINNVTMYEVDLLPKEISDSFRSGMNADVDFIIQKKDHILLVPLAAVNQKDNSSFVLLESAEGKKSARQDVQTGISDDKNIEIVSGLSEDDNVILKQKKFSLNKGKGGSNPFMANRRPGGGGRQ